MSKLVFIFLLGNEIEFGYAEAVALLSAPKFSEKQIGYLFVSVLMTDSHELIAEVAKAINHDLRSVKELEVWSTRMFANLIRCRLSSGFGVMLHCISGQYKDVR